MPKIKSVTLNVLMVMVLICLAAGKPKLVKTKVNDQITVSIPKTWRAMDNLDFTERYPSVRAPLAAYTDEERLVDFAVNVSATQWPDADLEMVKSFFKSSLLNMFDRVDMLSEGVRDVNGKKFIFFEFDSRVNGNRQQEGFTDPVMKYTYIGYLVQPGRTLVFSFNCPRRIKEEWKDTAKAMMNAIRVK
ncbi:hypothetical protein [Pseudochryseolinea flava]|uniref:PsbP C-terminal domain-containing protein n=1 Tax=Pseudochryseolinea flava TaxID=2059302 RepID=A0A364XTX2_9BACT|nr:hypothetical protein [Pseudochryseolinea flava]RAV97692.1 hypothetical protein DQQ10_27275 [Pseudochryseolinea flava]